MTMTPVRPIVTGLIGASQSASAGIIMTVVTAAGVPQQRLLTPGSPPRQLGTIPHRNPRRRRFPEGWLWPRLHFAGTELETANDQRRHCPDRHLGYTVHCCGECRLGLIQRRTVK